jgi:RNA polymerase sigma factor (sigma-70 family)
MQELDDITLLREYVERDSEEAFASLVTRHVNKVYSVALRHTRNPHQAEEITQAVFVILARKSRHLGKRVILSGWLYQTAQLTALTFLRSEIRRARREQEAHMQTVLNESESDVWPQIAPLLDAAIAGLGEVDRHAVVLRFFDGKSMKEVGVALGASEDAAKMRLSRAVEKLRLFFTKRGVVLPAAVLTAAISANSVQAAPAMLARTATAVAFAKGATVSGSTLTLIKGALNLMAWTQAKTAFVVGVGVLLAVGSATTFINLKTDTPKPELVENPPPEPEYEGKLLREWITATPPTQNVITLDDIVSYRRTALSAMGEPAVRYLHWMVAHPRQAFDEHNTAPDRLSQRVLWRRQKLPNHSPDLANFMNAVVALQWIGPSAREAVPDLVRLWESTGNPMYSHYNGFPLALAALGDTSPETLAALHRHYMSSDRPHFQTDRLHRVLSAFAAWRLNPNDKKAIAVLRNELTTTDSEVHSRYALLETFSRYGTNASPFLLEIRNLIDASIIAKPEYQSMAARAAWRILNTPEPAAAAIQRLSKAAVRPEATTNDVNHFTASALDLAEVPGVRELSVPILKELSHYPEASAATFAENVLDRLEAGAQGRTTSPP